MGKFFIVGGNPLVGEIKIDSAKNALLPILAGCILIEGEVLLKDVPKYSDVLAMCEILEDLGGKTTWQDDDLIVDCTNINKGSFSSSLASCLRASIFTLGPLLARVKEAKLSYPGGCDIGLRPVDIHIGALKNLGCKVVEKNGYIYSSIAKAKAGEVVLSFPSVGATENIMMFATCLKGRTKIIGGAKEPEIVDLQNFINACGGFVRGAGSDEIIIEGRALHGCQYKVIPDRIEAGTFMIGVAMNGGKVEIIGGKRCHNESLIAKLSKTACKITTTDDKIIVEAKGRPLSFGEVETAVFPGFPTDLQAQMMALSSISQGCSVIVENLFESRFKHAQELMKMGADIKVKNGVCVISGREKLFGAEVVSTDLRGGASLVLAGLVAEGYTTVDKVELIDRGYYKFEEKLQGLGANIKRI